MQNLFIIPIEPIETRYTIHWHEHIPALFSEASSELNVVTIDGDDVPPTPTPGAFLDFGATNIYKSSQLIKIAEMFRTGLVNAGDKFLFTDAWNTSILQVKYMSELLNIPVEMHGLWHAGSYDSFDFLGRLIKDKRWTNCTEKAIFHCLDVNWFATEFHQEMFKENVFGETNGVKSKELTDVDRTNKFKQTGWPMEYMADMIAPYETEKEDIILFPHRLAPEKQVEIFNALAKALPQYQFITCQNEKLTKDEYHKLLGKAKMVFSANQQETLGISAPEGMAAGCMPLVPDRLCYSEMYSSEWKYPSIWTSSIVTFETHGAYLVDMVKTMMENYNQSTLERIATEYNRIHKIYFTADNLIKEITK